MQFRLPSRSTGINIPPHSTLEKCWSWNKAKFYELETFCRQELKVASLTLLHHLLWSIHINVIGLINQTLCPCRASCRALRSSPSLSVCLTCSLIRCMLSRLEVKLPHAAWDRAVAFSIRSSKFWHSAAKLQIIR